MNKSIYVAIAALASVQGAHAQPIGSDDKPYASGLLMTP